jgi:hypothetical protein
MDLPRYEPPCDRHAAVAAGVAPLIVLLVFTAVVARWMDVDTAAAIVLASAVWVIHELTAYQRRLDDYNRDFSRRHLRRLSPQALLHWAEAEDTPDTTRDLIRSHLAADGTCRPDGPGR